MHGRLESRSGHLQFVSSDGNAIDVVRARVVGLAFIDRASIFIRGGDFRALNRRTGWVRNGSHDGGGYLLAQRKLGRADYTHQQE